MYEIVFKPKALKDLKGLPSAAAKRIVAKVELLSDGLAGDVRKLTNFRPEDRLRVGNFRVLFELEGEAVVVYRVLDRKDAYQ